MRMIKATTIITLISILLAGCSSSGRYTMKHDKAPLRKPTTLEMNDATPRHEPIYPRSLEPYKVFGKKYYPLKDANNFAQSGQASWYGRKFHGHHTANGEIYDMYAMTAAHKTLPIPSYVRVTNLNNQKTVIVRVNDRGPFHPGRIIDLSYSAAYALDMLNTGVANVQIEAIVLEPGQVYNEENPEPITALAERDSVSQQVTQAVPEVREQVQLPISSQAPPGGNSDIAEKAQQSTQTKLTNLFVQVLAASDGARIMDAAKRLSKLLDHPRQIPREDGIYKLRFGPLSTKEQAQDIINTLKNNGYPNAYMLYTAPAL